MTPVPVAGAPVTRVPVASTLSLQHKHPGCRYSIQDKNLNSVKHAEGSELLCTQTLPYIFIISLQLCDSLSFIGIA